MAMKVRRPAYTSVTELDLRLYVSLPRIGLRISHSLGPTSNEAFHSPFVVGQLSCQCPPDMLSSNQQSTQVRHLLEGR